MITDIDTIEQATKATKDNDAVLLYFSTPQCRVCKVLKPKIHDMLNETFPKVRMFYVDIEKIPQAGADFSVFAAPTIIFYMDGKEFARHSRNIGVTELAAQIERPYSIFMS